MPTPPVERIGFGAVTTATPRTPAHSPQDGLDRWFEVTARGSTYRTEVIGGVTTFLTLVYIVFVNPASDPVRDRRSARDQARL